MLLRSYTIYSFRGTCRPFKDRNGVNHEGCFQIIHPNLQTATIKGKYILPKGKNHLSKDHGIAKVYISDDPGFAKVSSKGKITADERPPEAGGRNTPMDDPEAGGQSAPLNGAEANM